MEKLTAFVSRFEGEKPTSTEAVHVHSTTPSQTSSALRSSVPHAFNIASILSNETRRYVGEVRDEIHQSNATRTSKFITQLESTRQFLV